MISIKKLASDYMKSIDHGLEEPRGGGFDIMRDLHEDLVKEQKQNKDRKYPKYPDYMDE
jgi:hypothetical protein